MQNDDSNRENAATKERAGKDQDQGRNHDTAAHQNQTSPGTTSNESSSQPATSRFEKFASTQAGGDGIEGDVLKTNKTTEEKLGANMADRK